MLSRGGGGGLSGRRQLLVAPGCNPRDTLCCSGANDRESVYYFIVGARTSCGCASRARDYPLEKARSRIDVLEDREEFRPGVIFRTIE